MFEVCLDWRWQSRKLRNACDIHMKVDAKELGQTMKVQDQLEEIVTISVYSTQNYTVKV